MRIPAFCTRWCTPIFAAGWMALAAWAAPPEADQTVRVTTSAPAPPSATRPDTATDDRAQRRLASIDAALHDGRWAAALAQTRAATQDLGPSAELRLRAAQAYFQLGQILGTAEVREVPDGRPGQWTGGWLLLERRGPRRFLCCPEASALYQLRRALDAGLDVPAAHLLHARIWQAIGKPQVGFSLLKSREAVLLEKPDAATLQTFASLALESDALDDFLRYAQMRAAVEPQRRKEILSDAYVSVAERYAQRGESALYRGFAYRALQLRPDDVHLALEVADAEWSAGHRADAARLYRRVLEQQPDHPRRAAILERLATCPPAPAPHP